MIDDEFKIYIFCSYCDEEFELTAEYCYNKKCKGFKKNKKHKYDVIQDEDYEDYEDHVTRCELLLHVTNRFN